MEGNFMNSAEHYHTIDLQRRVIDDLRNLNCFENLSKSHNWLTEIWNLNNYDVLSKRLYCVARCLPFRRNKEFREMLRQRWWKSYISKPVGVTLTIFRHIFVSNFFYSSNSGHQKNKQIKKQACWPNDSLLSKRIQKHASTIVRKKNCLTTLIWV